MRVKREEELIGRLIDILEYKQLTYQNKLDELDKKKEIEKILSKYPGEPFRGLIELELEEITTLLSYFTDEEYDADDINTKKYWMIEASVNEALKKTSRYQEANKLFERLGDKLQEYLETLKGIEISETETEKLLGIVTSLNDHLKNKKPISDLTMYYPVLVPSETLVENDIYNFFIALALNNLNLIKSGKTVAANNKLKLTKDMKKYLVELLENQIATYEEEKNKKVVINQKLVSLSKLIDTIKDNYEAIIDVYPQGIEQVMDEIWREDVIEETIDGLMIPITVIKGKRQGLNIDFNDEDLFIIDKFIKQLKREEVRISEKELKDKKEREEKITREIETLHETLTKLDGTNVNYFEEDDFNNLVKLLKEQKQDYEFIKKVIVVLNALNFNINGDRQESDEEEKVINTKEELDKYQAKLEKNIELEDSKEEKIEDNYDEVLDLSQINLDDINFNNKEDNLESTKNNELEELFSVNGFNYNEFPKKLINNLLTETTYDHLKEMLEFINSNKELSFLKEYTCNLGEESIKKKIHDIKCSEIYFMLVYSNVDILNGVLEIAKRDNLDLKDIFAIPKVFGSNTNGEDGTYENFVANEKLIYEEYQEVLDAIMKRCPYVLGTDKEIFKQNIELTEAYNMSIVEDKRGAFPSPKALATQNFEYVMDRYIEAKEYDYIERFRSQLETNSSVSLRIRYLQLKGIDFKQGGFVDIESKFDNELKEALKDASIENIAVGINDELIKWLDSINEEKDKEMEKVQYILKGIYISKLKVLKNYSTILINGYKDKEKALLYSITKDSYLTDEEYDMLKTIVENREAK